MTEIHEFYANLAAKAAPKPNLLLASHAKRSFRMGLFASVMLISSGLEMTANAQQSTADVGAYNTLIGNVLLTGYSTAGTYTFTPSPNWRQLCAYVEGSGGGGGGGPAQSATGTVASGGGGGGSGGVNYRCYSPSDLPASASGTLTITVAAGGAGGAGGVTQADGTIGTAGTGGVAGRGTYDEVGVFGAFKF